MKKVFIATARDVGKECIEWAQVNTPANFRLVNSMHEADIVFSIMYDKLIPPEILKNKVCFNFHPGILPEYKGAGIFSWALINNEEKAGVTLHLIDSGIDTGDIIEIREFLISKADTAHTLFLRGEQTILRMFKDWYCDLMEEKYIAVPQRNSKLYKTYYRKDLEKAKDLTRFAKAFYFPKKESAYYINQKSEKIYLDYVPKEENKQ
jgi:methionyl-tRNA formyltransferase